MILDELDSGVGAKLGKSVGCMLRRMAAWPDTQQNVILQSEVSKQRQLDAQQQSLVQPELSAWPGCRNQDMMHGLQAGRESRSCVCLMCIRWAVGEVCLELFEQLPLIL